MSRSTRPLPFVVAAALAVGGPLTGQVPSGLPLLDEAEEVRLARSAAPRAVADGADVWVLRASGLARAVRGANGWTCLVDRDDPRTLAPQCFDPEGTRALLPALRALYDLWDGERGYAAAMDSVAALVDAGALPRVQRPVLSYMLSREQRLVAAPGGPEIGAWRPHLMVFWPGLTMEAMGLPEDSGLMMVNAPGTALSYLILPVDRWSDGGPAGEGR